MEPLRLVLLLFFGLLAGLFWAVLGWGMLVLNRAQRGGRRPVKVQVEGAWYTLALAGTLTGLGLLCWLV